MQISSDKILNKMAGEIAKAKGSDSHKAKEHLLVVRALCDLLLDEQTGASVYVEPTLKANVVAPQMPIQPIASFSGEPVYVKEDDANGNSLLDF
ncbi:YwdI family protein [Bacillus cytotoxicus]|uniref:YwdI family protein n=1 Tax=Bacillus cytotoxicus TaxID=580165 RepID=A0ACC6A636_9BACI|nr:YwdI family protein [Bacillus cytotoxicus]HDX9579354.1 YwdI family protein [Bacillus pseudomycoides]